MIKTDCWKYGTTNETEVLRLDSVFVHMLLLVNVHLRLISSATKSYSGLKRGMLGEKGQRKSCDKWRCYKKMFFYS